MFTCFIVFQNFGDVLRHDITEIYSDWFYKIENPFTYLKYRHTNKSRGIFNLNLKTEKLQIYINNLV